jgi:hypothetical protein
MRVTFDLPSKQGVAGSSPAAPTSLGLASSSSFPVLSVGPVHAGAARRVPAGMFDLGGRSTIAEPGSQALAQIPISMRLVPKPPVGTIASVTTEHLPFDEAADNMA